MTYPSYADDFQLPRVLDGWVEAVGTHYDQKGVPLPERRYWMIGTSAHDCEQMVITVQQMFLGTAAAPTELSTCSGPRALTFNLEVIRCTPTVTNRGRAPEALAIQESSVDPVIDLEILLDIAYIFDPDNAGIMATADVVPAQGGFHGAIAAYTVNLTGL